MTIARQQEISYSTRKSILDSPKNDIILLTTMTVATLIASCCNAGLGSHTCHLSLQIGWKKRKDHLERYLSTMYGI